MHMTPRMIAGRPSTKSMKRQPDQFANRSLPTCTSHVDTGAPITLDSGIAMRNSAVARARNVAGNQKVR